MKVLFLACILLSFSGCGNPDGEHKPVAAKTQVTSAETTDTGVGFREVSGIFARECAACHPSRLGPDWLDYAQAKRYADNGLLFRRVITERSMPPPGSAQAASISEADRETIGRWATSGGPMESGLTARDAVETTAGTGRQTQSTVSDIGVLPEARQCLQCHGLDGPQAEAELKIPRLAGQNSLYLFQQMQRFRWRERIDPTNTMNDIAGHSDLDEETLRKISDYFSNRPAFGRTHVPKFTQSQAEIFKRGGEIAHTNCVQCHMNPIYPKGTSDPSLPALAGQSEQYLRNQLLYFRDNDRQSPLMHEFARGLKKSDIAALSYYFANIRRAPLAP